MSEERQQSDQRQPSVADGGHIELNEDDQVAFVRVLGHGEDLRDDPRIGDLMVHLDEGPITAPQDVERFLDAAIAVTPPTEAPSEVGLPPDESPARDTVCDALTRALLDCGETAGEAGERTMLDLESEEDMRGLVRLLTSRSGKGYDGPWGERTKLLWETIGRALSAGRRASSEEQKT